MILDWMQIWYTVAKTLAEKAAWDFSKEKGLNVVAINTGTALGPILPPDMNARLAMIAKLLQGMHRQKSKLGIGKGLTKTASSVKAFLLC